MATIDVRNLSKDFGDFAAVRAASFTVEDGQFVCLLGPSGCGKTTTLRMIAGLELPTSGSISLAGEDVTHKRASERDIAFVFQLFALYPHMNVRRNIEYPLRNIGMPKAERTRRVAEAARILRIGHLLDRSVSGLSSGDRQRVALGRAIVREPAAFMMDEPLGALDAEFRHLMCGELRALHDRLRATTVYVTHDQLEAMAMADRIAVMNAGVIEQFGPPQDIYDRPATLFVADFIGSPPMNFVGFAGSLRPRRPGDPHRGCEPARPRTARRPGGGGAHPRRAARTRAPLGRGMAARRGLRVRVSRHHPGRDRPHAPRAGSGEASGQRERSAGRDGRPRVQARQAHRSSTGPPAGPIRTALTEGGAGAWLGSSSSASRSASRISKPSPSCR